MHVPLAALERLDAHLRTVSDLVDLQQERSPRFAGAVVLWVEAAETALRETGASGTSGLAALRSRLLSALHGVTPRDGLSRRRTVEAVASAVLEDAQRQLDEVLAPHRDRMHEAERIALQLAAVARVKGVLAGLDRAAARQQTLQQLLAALTQDPDTAAAAAHVQGLVGVFDTLVVLDRALPELV